MATVQEKIDVQVRKEKNKIIWEHLQTIAISAITVWGYSELFARGLKYLPTSLITTLGGLGALLVVPLVERLMNAFKYFLPKAIIEKEQQVLQKASARVATLRALAEEKKLKHYSVLANEIQNYIDKCRSYLENVQFATFAQFLIKPLKILISIPYETTASILRNKSQAERVAFRKNIAEKGRKLLKPFSGETKKLLASFISDVIQKTAPKSTLPDDKKIKPILLVGPPGIGKTTLAQKIAKMIGGACCMVNMGNYEKASFFGEIIETAAGPAPKAGDILKTITNKDSNPNNITNFVLILDEADKPFGKNSKNAAEIAGMLIKLCETNNILFWDKALNAPIDMRNAVIIITANNNFLNKDSSLSPEIKASLKDRMRIIEMPDLSKEVKQEILIKKSKQMINSDNIKDKHQKAILTGLMNEKIKQIIEDDQQSGLRDVLEKLNIAYLGGHDENLNEMPGCRADSFNLRKKKQSAA